MKLHEVPKNSIIYEECTDGSTWLKFKKIDGIYSVCITEKGNIVNLGINTEVKTLSLYKYTIIKI